MYKYITVPKDMEAMNALDYNTASNDQLIELVLSENNFNLLWSSGVFQAINEIANVNIDFAEDESIIEAKSLESIISSDFMDRDYLNEDLNVLVAQLKELLLLALHYKTGIFFYF